MQKVVVKLLDLDLNDEDCKQRSIEAVSAQFWDVTISTDAEENTLTVIGRRVVPQAEIVSVETVEEAKPKKVQLADPIASAAADRVSKVFDTIRHSKQAEPKLDSRFKTKQGSTFIKPAGFGQYGKVDKQGGFVQNFNPPGLPAGFVDHKHGGFAKNFNPPGIPPGFLNHTNYTKAPEFGKYGFVDEHKNPYVGLLRDTSTSSAPTGRDSSTISGTGTGSSTGAGTSRSSSTFSASSTGTSRSSSTFSTANEGTSRSSSTFSAASKGTSRGSSTTSAASILTSRGTSRIPDNSRDTRTTTEISRQEKKKKEKK
ncbi:hypothetical protein MKW92_051771 [Papaver armeniacum]|nr:hypothetical protein MKW92_051771 [Papaver armeniacum]